MEYLYEGPKDDNCAQAFKNCDPKGPALVFVSKVISSIDQKEDLSLVRIYSGTLEVGSKIYIMG